MLQVNQILQSRYRIDRIMGQGGMGAVYLAYDQNLELACVVKEMLPPADPALVKNVATQFHREGKILAGLRHQSLPRVSNYFTEGDNYYLVMDLIEGQSLDKLIGQDGLPEKTVIGYADQLLDVLSYIHGKGILHRDIKPANIIVQPDGRAVLVDFGLVKIVGSGQNTRTLVSALTPQYAPPEQYTGGTDQRSDLYSLAATLYQSLSGQAPASATDQLAGIKLQPLREWPHLRNGVSANTERVLMKGLNLNRDLRYQSAGEMKADLDDPTGGHRPISSQELAGMETQVWNPPDAAAPESPGPVTPVGPAQPLTKPSERTKQPFVEPGTVIPPVNPISVPVKPGPATPQPAHPPVPDVKPKQPMSSGAKVILIGGIVGLLLVVACCAVFGIPIVSQALNEVNQTATAQAAVVDTAVRPTAATTSGATTVETPAPTADKQATKEARISETVAAQVQATTDAMASATPSAGNELQLALAPGVNIELVRVPAGIFLMGAANSDPQADANEKPQSRTSVGDFYIGKYDVTNAQFAAFVKDTGYNTTADDLGSGTVLITTTHSWVEVKGANWQHPRGPGSNIVGKDDYPVVMVSWDDAVAFCKWVSDKTGRRVRLPSEAQWEMAARGGNGQMYPWGNEPPTSNLANFNNNESGLMPVGDYSPAGDSPYGAADMAGNVWQWTSSLYKPYPFNATDGREDGTSRDSRVVRGGSYPNPPRYLRVTERLWYLPGDRYEAVGFRVAAQP